jgi:putative glutathione S-transferase
MTCSGPPAPDYYPAALRSEIDDLSAEIAKRINMGIYLAGFAQSQVGAFAECRHARSEGTDDTMGPSCVCPC